MGQSNMDTSEKLETQGAQDTRRRNKRQKSTQYALDTAMCKQTQIT